MTRLLPALAVAATLLVALTGCDLTGGGEPPAGPGTTEPGPGETVAETTAPEAAVPPPLDGLVLTTEGIGTLEIGGDPAPGEPTDMVVFDPDFCTDERTGQEAGVDPGSEFAGLWVPIEQYGAWGEGYSSSSFQVRVEGSTLFWIAVLDELIPTDAGVRIGQLDDEVFAAYPDADVIDNGISELVVVQGVNGKIVVEIARDPEGERYWTGSDLNRVIALGTLDNATEPFALAGTGGGPGACSIF